MILALIVLAHLLGVASALRALFTARTSQGTVAWILSLVLVPYLAVPAYWLMGSSRFEGYLSARRGKASRLKEEMKPVIARIHECRMPLRDERGAVRAAERMVRLPTLRGNTTRLLIDGEETFESLFEGIDGAQQSVVVQFYILRDDAVGRELQRRLIERARAGLVVCLLYDKIGSYSLPRSYVRELEAAGVQVRAFRSTRFGYPTRFQINFRNHRKVVVVDGRAGWVGGFNVGDEYLGDDPSFGPWRDTHLRVEGPAALALQLSFVEDWYWATESVPELPWEPVEAGDEPVLILPSGPEGPGDTTGMLVQLAIHHARSRVWIATPYFVPTDAVVEALKLAAYRGLDVRILTGRRSDSRVMDLARYPTLERLLGAGARVFGYREGYLHAKTIVIDRFAAGVSTVNLDHRSFRLNFEITALLFHHDAVNRVARSFERDFERSTEFSVQEVAGRSLPARIASRTVQLAAPIL